MTGYEVQGFTDDGAALWSTGVVTLREVLQQIERATPSLDEGLVALLIRRGPQVEVMDGDCPVIGPWSLRPAECPDCALGRATDAALERPEVAP